jgi:hypothetical protein
LSVSIAMPRLPLSDLRPATPTRSSLYTGGKRWIHRTSAVAVTWVRPMSTTALEPSARYVVLAPARRSLGPGGHGCHFFVRLWTSCSEGAAPHKNASP